MKTPIQELIEVLKKAAQYISDNDHIEDRMYRSGLREAIENAESLLEREKEVIVAAYDAGKFNCLSIFGGNRQHKDYYNETFSNDDE